ncbi:MAG TPA: TetR family transcriptional regulator [Acidimicrobiales bacterium]|jgi:AcrR family transcriptional regulator|nr:TetR family transcriptional regulator [Acidimicrobiales bacterium]
MIDVDAHLGLRERKKLRTRRLIAETARRLFVERGFEAVPVAEVAREAEVSEATVFNYFPTKEDLVFHGMELFEDELLEAVRERPAGQSIVHAFERFVLQPRGFLAANDEASASSLIAVSRMLADSPALQAREREILARYAASLATVIAEDTGAAADDLRPQVVAHALIGTHRSLIDFVRRRLLTGPVDRRRLARDVQRHGRAALALLEAGLADYGCRPAGGTGTTPATAPPRS